MAKVSAQQSFIEDLVCPGPVTATKALSIGETLRAARKKRGLKSLDKIAREICARPHHIQAMEEDQFDLFPGSTYAMGFIRSYAAYLGLDAGQLVQRFKDEIAAGQQTPKLVFLESLDGPRMPKWIMAATILVLFAGSYATWLGLNSENSPPLRAGVLVAEAAPHPAGASGSRKYAARTEAVQGSSTAAGEARSLQPTPVARVVKVLPRGQKAVDASPVSQASGDSLALLDAPNSAEATDKLLPVSDDLAPPQASPLVLTSGNAGPPDAGRTQVSFEIDPLIHQ